MLAIVKPGLHTNMLAEAWLNVPKAVPIKYFYHKQTVSEYRVINEEIQHNNGNTASE